MKRTEIHYQKTVDDYIRVIKIKNAATEHRIEKEVCADVRRIYINNSETWFARVHPGAINTKDSIRINTGGGGWHYLNVGGLYSRPDFQKRIELMKQAGNRLTEIRKAVAAAAENPVKVIKI